MLHNDAVSDQQTLIDQSGYPPVKWLCPKIGSPKSVSLSSSSGSRWPISAMGQPIFSNTQGKWRCSWDLLVGPVRKKNALRGSTSWGSTQLGNKVRIPLGCNRSYRWININPTYPTYKWIITPHLQSGMSRKAIMRFRQCLVVRELI